MMSWYTPFRSRPIRAIILLALLCAVLLALAKVDRRVPQCALQTTQSDPPLHALDIWNRHRITYDPLIGAQFERLMMLQPASDNGDLVQMVKTLLDPPANHPVRKTVHGIFQTPQASHVDRLYKGQVCARRFEPWREEAQIRRGRIFIKVEYHCWSRWVDQFCDLQVYVN